MAADRTFGGVLSDPGIDPRVRRALDRFARTYLWVAPDGAVTINDEGKLELVLNGATLSATTSGLRINPSGSPVIAGLTITGLTGYLYATSGVVSAVPLSNAPTVIASSVTQQGNTQPNETALFVATIPAGTLSATGDSLEFAACGTFTSGGSRRLRVRFGATSTGLENTILFDTGSFTTTASDWSLRGSITRSGATSQKNEVTIITTSTTTTNVFDYSNVGGGEYLKQSYQIVEKYNDVDYTTSSETLADALYLSVTGFHASSSSVVVGERFKVSRFPG